MNRFIAASLAVAFAGALSICASTQAAKPKADHAAADHSAQDASMKLGNFSLSLTVKDIAASRAFYEKLGFKAWGGDAAKGWLIMQNDTSTIGLFKGVFEKNTMTFNPGWDRNGKPLADFEDVRDIQRQLKSKGIELKTAADESTNGPAALIIVDPDGNPIVIDQHVPAPKK
jgi:catechol 2,3-dioxygenase-like lactoylglutathione lyase family enzyme